MKISCIVAAYNCEKYIVQCVDSIINQSYTDLEIILVDDGSNDGTSLICDEYCLKDNRIIAIHKENGGVSSARNAGISVATGSFISFIDSDDFLHPDFYGSLAEIVRNNDNVGIATAGFHFYANGKNTVYNEKWEISKRVFYSPEQYMEKLMRLDTSCVVWDRIYDAGICKSLRFVDGRLNEDFLFNYHFVNELIRYGKGVVTIPEKLFFYRKNAQSTTHARLRDNLVDQVININEIVDDLGNTSETLRNAALSTRVLRYTELLHFLTVHAGNEQLLMNYHKEFRTIPIMMVWKALKEKERIIGTVLWINPAMLNTIICIKRKLLLVL